MFKAFTIYNTKSATDANAPQTAGTAASGTSTYYSDTWAGAEHGWGLTVVTTGTLTGTWTLWATDKERPSLADDTDWVDMSSSAEFTKTNPSGSATKWRADSSLLRAGRYRLKYVNASGTGNLFGYVFRNER